MNIKHLVKVYFEKRSSVVTTEWLAQRFRLFRDFTLQSLRYQTLVDFQLWICCSVGMENEVLALQEIVPRNTLWTFGGSSALPSEIRGSNFDYLYITRIDSDDLFSRDALELVSKLRPRSKDKIEVGVFSRGFLFEISSGRLGTYYKKYSPFHTLMVPRNIVLDLPRYQREFIGDHGKIGAYRVHQLPDWRVCVLIHQTNWMSTFDQLNLCSLRTADWDLSKFLAGKYSHGLCPIQSYST